MKIPVTIGKGTDTDKPRSKAPPAGRWPPTFNTSWQHPKMQFWCKFDDTSSNPLQVVARISQISEDSESKWPKWPWKSMSMTPIFKTAKSILACMFSANLVIPAQICDEILHRQAEFPTILSQNGQNDLECPSQWPLHSGLLQGCQCSGVWNIKLYWTTL